MRLPTEEVLQFIEASRKISICRDKFVSREYYNPHHSEGRHFPAFYANSGRGDGIPVVLVELKDAVYVVDSTGKPFPDPVSIIHSGRGII